MHTQKFWRLVDNTHALKGFCAWSFKCALKSFGGQGELTAKTFAGLFSVNLVKLKITL